MQNSQADEEKSGIPPTAPLDPPPGYQYSQQKKPLIAQLGEKLAGDRLVLSPRQMNVPVDNVIVRQPPLTDPPKDYLVEAILVTVCCFWPTGIVAIIKAFDAQRGANTGDRQLAELSSREARKFVCISLWLGVAAVVLCLLLLALYVFLLITYV